MSEKNKAILEKANAAVARGDYGKFASFCTEDTEWTFVGDKVLKGKQAVEKWMTAEYIEPPVNNVTDLIAEGDFLTAIGEIKVKNKDGKTDVFSYCDVWRFRDGKMAELRAFVIEKKGDEK